MAQWRFGRGWSYEQLEARLEALPGLKRNFSDSIEQMSLERGWHQYFSEATVAQGPPGQPEKGGLFERGREAVGNYEFSDPRIVRAHFDPEDPLPGRYMLLEMQVFGVLRYLGGVVVGAVRSEQSADQTVFGFRYDTLEGHIEQGAEWFLLTKAHRTGSIRFRIEAMWRPGQFPNWWSRIGFSLVGPYYQKRWHRRAHRLMARLVHSPSASGLKHGPGKMAHSNPDIIFERTRGHHG